MDFIFSFLKGTLAIFVILCIGLYINHKYNEHKKNS